MIRHDVSPLSVVTTCSRCPHWSAFAFSLDDARERGIEHKINVHDVAPARARFDAMRQATRRGSRATS